MGVREAYCPAHFGNSYEAMGPREMARYLAEMRYWGFNRYGDWMTLLGFVHIGYGDVAGNGDIYTKFGAVIAAQRLPATLEGIAAQGAEGYQAYSEGVFDDVNKALLAALSSGRARTADEALREYAARYFGARVEEAARWSRWLADWGDRAAVDLPAARAEFERLATRAMPGWRLEHLRSKLALEELDRALGEGGETWDAERLALAERFWEERERLERHVYGLGPVRHVFAPQFAAPRWYAGWQAATRGAPVAPQAQAEA